MYKRIIRSKIHSIFDEINRANYMPMVDGLAPKFEYRFHGDHALGGRRTTRDAMIRWWQRTFELLPSAQFDIKEILVDGGPWKTRVAIRSLVSGDLPGGKRYANTVFQHMTIVWGKVVSVETMEDLQILDEALRSVAESGKSDALARPIED